LSTQKREELPEEEKKGGEKIRKVRRKKECYALRRK
jgi:hypothetical protein